MTALELVRSGQRYAFDAADVLEWFAAMPENSVDLVFGSPPYPDKGKRYIGGQVVSLPLEWWARWMLAVSRQALRVCRGDVLWVVNGTVADGSYHPAVEYLQWLAYESGLTLERPCIWNKNAPPNRRDWFGNDWEYVICFRQPGARSVWEWEKVAEAPKHKSGGAFRQRGADGQRRAGGDYPTNPLARPRDVFRATVGGGHMGHALASENEAPFPEKVPAYFLPALCPVGGIVADPFIGSGTTAAVALAHGLNCIGCDVRASQVELAYRRMRDQFPGIV